MDSKHRKFNQKNQEQKAPPVSRPTDKRKERRSEVTLTSQ